MIVCSWGILSSQVTPLHFSLVISISRLSALSSNTQGRALLELQPGGDQQAEDGDGHGTQDNAQHHGLQRGCDAHAGAQLLFGDRLQVDNRQNGEWFLFVIFSLRSTNLHNYFSMLFTSVIFDSNLPCFHFFSSLSSACRTLFLFNSTHPRPNPPPLLRQLNGLCCRRRQRCGGRGEQRSWGDLLCPGWRNKGPGCCLWRADAVRGWSAKYTVLVSLAFCGAKCLGFTHMCS